jgi:hypothetical protein
MEVAVLPQIKISFSLYGDCEEIDLIPDKLKIKGWRIKRKTDYANLEYAEDSWTTEIGYEEVLDVGILTDKLYKRIIESTDLINQIKDEFALNSIIIIVIQSDINKMPITVLNRRIIQLAYETSSEIHFDNYFDVYE